MNRRSAFASLATLCSFIVTGCFTANDWGTRKAIPIGPTPSIRWGDSQHPPIIAIRYVSAVEESALSSFRRRFVEGPYYLGWPRMAGVPTEASFYTTLQDTAFYASNLREALQAALPGTIVVLEPERIVKSRSDGFAWSLDPKQRPTIDVLVDFTAYTHPLTDAVSSGWWRNVTSVRISPAIAPTTKGLVAISECLHYLPTSVDTGMSGPYDAEGATVVEAISASDREFRKQPPLFSKALYSKTRPWDGNKVVLFGDDEWILPILNSQGEYSLPPDLSNWYAAVITDAINVLSEADPSRRLDPQWVSLYDPHFNPNVPYASLNDNLRQRANVLADIKNAEARLLTAQSDAISKDNLNGPLSEALQKRENEEIAFGKAAYAQEVQNINRQLIASLAMVGNLAANQPTANTSLIAQEEADEATNSAQHDAIQRQIAGAQTLAANQTRVDVTLLGKQAVISAGSLEELRAKLRLIYTSAFGGQ